MMKKLGTDFQDSLKRAAKKQKAAPKKAAPKKAAPKKAASKGLFGSKKAASEE